MSAVLIAIMVVPLVAAASRGGRDRALLALLP